MLGNLAFSDYELSAAERVLRHRGEIVKLPPKAIDVLEALARRMNEVVLKDELIDTVWAHDPVEDGSLTQLIFQLRRAFKNDGMVSIETIPRRGYRLSVRARPASPPPVARGRGWLRASSVGAALAMVAVVGLSASSRLAGGDPIAVQQAYSTWFNARNTDEVRRSVAEFQAILRTWPDNAFAHAGLAYADLSLAEREPNDIQSAVDARSALVEATRAIELNEELAAGHTALAQADAQFGSAGQAEREFKKATSLDEEAVEAHTWYGEFLLERGRLPEASTELARAQSANSSWTEPGDDLALVAYLERRFGNSIALASQSLMLSPGDTFARYVRALSEAQGKPQAALSDARVLVALHPLRAIGAFALLSSLERAQGKMTESSRDLGRAEAIARSGGATGDPLVIVALASASAEQRDPDAAFAWLSRLSPRERRIYRNDARLDALRSRPEFRAWLRDA